MHNFPIGLVTVVAMALFASMGIACWTLGREQSFMDAPDQNRWRDLRLWATLIVVAQLALYYMLR